MMKKTNQQNGFTVIELLIATAIFSVFLLLLAIMTVRIGRLFQKGVITSKTQEAARSISGEIAKTIQFSGGPITTGTVGAVGYICAGSQRYMFTLGHQVLDSGAAGTQVQHALIADASAACPGSVSMTTFSSATQRELIPNRARLANLNVSASGTLYTIVVRVVYGEDDLLVNPQATNARCDGNRVGTEYCAMSELTTTVQKRL